MGALGDARPAQLGPRRSPPPAIGSGAAVGLVLVRTQRRRHKRRRRRRDSAVDLLGRTLRDLAREARRVADDVF